MIQFGRKIEKWYLQVAKGDIFIIHLYFFVCILKF